MHYSLPVPFSVVGISLPCLCGFRRISHSLNVFPFYDGERECRGYTLFSHLITMEKKSVGYIIKISPY